MVNKNESSRKVKIRSVLMSNDCIILKKVWFLWFEDKFKLMFGVEEIL